jgi:hypothetical protein
VFIAGRRRTELDNAVAEIGENVTAIEADESRPSNEVLNEPRTISYP